MPGKGTREGAVRIRQRVDGECSIIHPHTALRSRGDGELHILEAVLKLLGIDWSA